MCKKTHEELQDFIGRTFLSTQKDLCPNNGKIVVAVGELRNRRYNRKLIDQWENHIIDSMFEVTLNNGVTLPVFEAEIHLVKG